MQRQQGLGRPEPVLVGIGLQLHDLFIRTGIGVEGFRQLGAQGGGEGSGNAQGPGLSSQATGCTALGDMDRLMVEHPGELDAAAARHIGADAQGALLRIPFRRRARLDRFTQSHGHTTALQQAQQNRDRLALFEVTGWVGHQSLDLGDREFGIARPAFVEIADPAISQRFSLRQPVPISDLQLGQQARLAQGLGHGSRRSRPLVPMLLIL